MMRLTHRGPRALALAAGFAALTFGAACTSTTRSLPPAQTIGPDHGYRPTHVNRAPGGEAALPGRYVILTFSGGGTRATALAHGVLRELGATAGQAPGTTLLDAVDMVSSTSGGSVAAANFVLQGPEGYAQLHGPGGFLRHDGMADLAGQLLLNPFNIALFTATGRSRTEMLPEMLRRQAGFGEATFGDLRRLADRRRPFLMLNAADMGTGTRFTFTQEQLDRLCLDLRDIRLADAVAASAAFPVALTPLPLPVHSPCPAQALERAHGTGIMRGYDLQARVADQQRAAGAACAPPAPPSAVPGAMLFSRNPPDLPTALRQRHYLNLDLCGQPLPSRQRVHFAHLIDGGTADNLGLAAPLEALTGGAAGDAFGRAINRGEVRDIVLVMVNARSQGSVGSFGSALTPGIPEMILASIGTPIDGRSSGLIAEAGALEAVLQARFGSGVKVTQLAVDFERIADPDCRAAFQGIGTNWTLPAHEVDALQEMASAMLRANPAYLDLAQAGTDAAPGHARARAACDRLATRSGTPLAFGAAAAVR